MKWMSDRHAQRNRIRVEQLLGPTPLNVNLIVQSPG